jgi:hypothetical protein
MSKDVKIYGYFLKPRRGPASKKKKSLGNVALGDGRGTGIKYAM